MPPTEKKTGVAIFASKSRTDTSSVESGKAVPRAPHAKFGKISLALARNDCEFPSMIKRALPAVLALLSLGLPLHGQTTDRAEFATAAADPSRTLSLYRADMYSSVSGPALINSLPVMTLLDGRHLPISSELGRMGTTPLTFAPLALAGPTEMRKAAPSPVYVSDDPVEAVTLRRSQIYTSGEVGAFYGRSTGKYGAEEYGGYVIGELATDRFQIIAGASYRESTWREPRR
jgi:hypothetical protein